MASYQDDIESRFAWARQLITTAEKPAAKPVPASRKVDGSFGTDRNVISSRIGADGMAVYSLRQSVGM